MKTLSEAEAEIGHGVMVRLRGTTRFVTGVIRAIHSDMDEVTVEIPSIGETYDFKMSEAWPGAFVWIAFSGRSPTRVFLAQEELDLLDDDDEDWLVIDCFAIDPEGQMHPATLRLQRRSIDYVLTNGHMSD